MSRRVTLPTTDHVRAVAAQFVTEARNNGSRPTVTGLARRLGLTNPTFWRHFGDIADELVATTRAPKPIDASNPTPYEQLDAENTQLKRRNNELRHELDTAKAVIEKLALTNQILNERLDGGNAQVIPLRPRTKQPQPLHC